MVQSTVTGFGSGLAKHNIEDDGAQGGIKGRRLR